MPLVVALFGSHWSWDRSVVPSRVWRIAPATTRPGGDRGQEVRLHFFEDGSDPGRGWSWATAPSSWRSCRERSRASRWCSRSTRTTSTSSWGAPTQARCEPLWKVRRDRSESVLTTLRSPRLEVATPIRFLQVEGLRGEGARSVAGLRLDLEPLEIPHVVLVPLLWGAWLLLWARESLGPEVAGERDPGPMEAESTSGSPRRSSGRWLLRTPDVLVYALLAVAADLGGAAAARRPGSPALPARWWPPPSSWACWR